MTGDRLTTIDLEGTRRAYGWRAAAPCQLELTSDATGLRTWVSFGLIDGELYAGPGTISAVGDDHTVCTDVGIYRLTDTGCTLTPRAHTGDAAATPVPARCGFELDGHAFHADDSDLARAAVGPTSAHRHRGVFMSTSLAMTPAERMPGEAAALDRARALAAATGRGSMPAPFPHPFAAWALPAARPRFRDNEPVWAAAMSRTDHWQIGLYFFSGRDGNALGLSSVWPSMAPAAFVQRNRPRPVHPAHAAVMIAEREGVTYGRYARTDWDRFAIAVLSGVGGALVRARERSAQFDVVRVIEPGAWDLGAPAAIRVGDTWRPAQVVRTHGARVYMIERGRLLMRPKADVRLVEVDAIHPPGTEVLAVPVAGLETPAFEPARVAEVVGDGLAYVVVTDAGDEYTVPFDQVMLRNPSQPPVAAQSGDDWASMPEPG